MSTWKHIKRLISFCLLEWQWFLAGIFFLLTYSAGTIYQYGMIVILIISVRIFIPLYTGIVIGNIVHSKGYAVLFQSVGIMAGLTVAR